MKSKTKIEIKTYHNKITKSIVKSVGGEAPFLEKDETAIKPKR